MLVFDVVGLMTEFAPSGSLNSPPTFGLVMPQIRNHETHAGGVSGVGGVAGVSSITGEFHDQGDTNWIVIGGSLWGHNDTPCGRPAAGRPIGRPGSGHPQGMIGGFLFTYIFF
jgi:hypothetical protein